MSHEDSNFLKTFASVVVGLLVFSILLATVAAILQRQLEQEVSEARLAAVDERIQPIGAVHTGDAGQQAARQAEGDEAEGEEAEAADAESEQTAAAAEEAAMSGQQVYQDVCAACHDTGAGGAPKLTQDAWADRIEKGKETLYRHSIEGFQGDAGMMPAKGGRTDLSDQEVKNAVDHMLSQVEGG